MIDKFNTFKANTSLMLKLFSSLMLKATKTVAFHFYSLALPLGIIFCSFFMTQLSFSKTNLWKIEKILIPVVTFNFSFEQSLLALRDLYFMKVIVVIHPHFWKILV